jgi:hypothetical protein
MVPWIAMLMGWTAAIVSAAIFALIGAALMLLVRPDRSVEQLPE